MKRLVALLALSLAACTPAAAYVGPAPTTPAVSTTVPVCQEDEPCWDCSTMGNGRCGPAAPTAVLGTALSCTNQGCVER